MKYKKKIAIILSAALILSSGTLCYGETIDETIDDDLDIVQWDYENLPELQKFRFGLDSEFEMDADPDNTTYDYSDNTVFIKGSGTVDKDRITSIIEAAENKGATENDIKNIHVGNGITYIHGALCNGDGYLPNLESIEFEKGHALDQIGRSAFPFHGKLKKLIINPGKKSSKDQGFEISHCAFRYCNLEKVVLNNIWLIGKRAFQGNTNIKKVDLGYLHHMRGDAFEGCSSLETITVDSDNPYFEVKEDGCLYEKLCAHYIDDNGLYNIEVPALVCVPATKAGETFMPAKGTRTIAYAAAASINRIKTAKAVTGVKQIQARAFYNCTNLKELYISKTVKHIGNEAFSKRNMECDDVDEDLTPDDYDNHPYPTYSDGDEDERIATGNITDVYYGGSEEDWKKIIYDKYDKKMQFCSNGGYVADNLKEIGLSANVVFHYNSEDPDILIPDMVKSGGRIAGPSAALLSKSKKVTFDTAYLGFTPTSYNVEPLDGSPAKGVKISKKWELKTGGKAGSYDVTLTDGSNSKTIRIYVEKPKMKAYKVKLEGENKYDANSVMLSGLTFLEPEKFESKKTSVAEINEETGIITPKAKGSTKITAYICGKKFKASFKVKNK